MRSPRRGVLGPSEGLLFYILSLVVEFFLKGTVQTLHSSKCLRRYNVQLNWANREPNFRCHRLFARVRAMIGKKWSCVEENNRCTVHLLRGLHFSGHKRLVFGTLIHRYRRHLLMKNEFGP